MAAISNELADRMSTNLRLLLPQKLPPSLKLPVQVLSARFQERDGDEVEEGVCPPCDVTLLLQTTSVDELNGWLDEFSEHTRTNYIVNTK